MLTVLRWGQEQIMKRKLRHLRSPQLLATIGDITDPAPTKMKIKAIELMGGTWTISKGRK
jgi:hypothetical protein